MSSPPQVRSQVEVRGVWKRYCRSLERGTRYALADSLRAVLGFAARDDAPLRADEFWSLQDVAFTLAPGQGLALCGRNGAGKSTLLKLLAGVISPDRGRLEVRGRVVSLLLVGAGFHPMLSGRENVYTLGGFLGLTRAELDARLPEIVDFAGLDSFLEMPVKYYSSGMSLRLAFSVAAFSRPDVLLIDEALAVGDGAFRDKCVGRLLELKAEGVSLVIASHSPGRVLRLTDQALWLEQGQVAACGPAGDVLERYAAALERRPTRLLSPTPAAATVSALTVALGSLTVDGVEPSRLSSGQEAAVEVTLALDGAAPGRRLRVALALEDATGAVLAEAEGETHPETYPALETGRWRCQFRVTPWLAPGQLQLALRVGLDGDEPLLERRWPCRVDGAAEGPGGAEPGSALRVEGGADLGGWGSVTPIDASPGARGALAELRRVELRAEGLLGALWRDGAPRLAVALGQGGDPPPVYLAPSEQVELRAVLSLGPVDGWALRVALRAPGGATCAVVLDGDAQGDVEACLRFPVHVQPGAYALDVELRARRADERHALVERDVAVCHVVGPAGVGLTAVAVEGVEEEAARADAAAPSAGADDLDAGLRAAERERYWGIAGRIQDFALSASAPGEPLELTLEAAFPEAAPRPSFKVSWLDPAGRRVAGLFHDPAEHTFEPVDAGGARRYRVRCRPHLGPGVYRADVALRSQRAGAWVVVDGRWEAATTLGWAPTRARGAPLLAGWVALAPS